MVFRAVKDCRRTADEQRYIWATLRVWPKLHQQRRTEIRALIERVGRTPEERRALYDLTVRGVPAEHTSRWSGIPVKQLYELRREFYERFVI